MVVQSFVLPTVSASRRAVTFGTIRKRYHSTSLLISDGRVEEVISIIEEEEGVDEATVTYNVVDSSFNDVMNVTMSSSPTPSSSTSPRRVSVLLCPAQFCVPADYDSFFSTISSRLNNNNDNNINNITLGTCRVAPLPRTEWIKVAKQLPTKEFLDANLSIPTTLKWYFDAMEEALSEIYAVEGEDANVAIVGHSIGGWVARAYLGGLSGSATAVYEHTMKRVSSFVTLGTPHTSPATALVDQTRGLLRAVEECEKCSSTALVNDRGIDVTCVTSASVEGKVRLFSDNNNSGGGGTVVARIEELVALTSYVPLTGKLQFTTAIKGDGIVPTELALMDLPARQIVLDNKSLAVRHAHVLPTPWNLLDGAAPSLPLPKDFLWYGSEEVVEEWMGYIR